MVLILIQSYEVKSRSCVAISFGLLHRRLMLSFLSPIIRAEAQLLSRVSEASLQMHFNHTRL